LHTRRSCLSTWPRPARLLWLGASRQLAFAIELEQTNIKVNVASPGYTKTAMNNFEETDTVEQGAQDIVRAALDVDGPTGTFTGTSGPLPW